LTDENLVRRALQLAAKGRGFTSPNPMVGAVIVANHEVISEGYHTKFGASHAEIEALRKLTASELKQAALYVNLEPCAHHGKQPPCVDAIIQSGIKKVIIGAMDPSPQVNGKGIAHLEKHGVTVQCGLLEKECRDFNFGFYHYQETGSPFVSLKFAQTLDGKIAAKDGSSKWITGLEARQETHRLRSIHDAVLVGVGAILQDDPELTVRHIDGVNPYRIVLDSSLKTPLTSKILNDDLVEKTMFFCGVQAGRNRVEQIEKLGAQVHTIDSSPAGLDLSQMCEKLPELGVLSLLVEGGRKIITSFVKRKKYHRFHIFIAPKILGDGFSSIDDIGVKKIDESLNLKVTSVQTFGKDIAVTAEVK